MDYINLLVVLLHMQSTAQLSTDSERLNTSLSVVELIMNHREPQIQASKVECKHVICKWFQGQVYAHKYNDNNNIIVQQLNSDKSTRAQVEKKRDFITKKEIRFFMYNFSYEFSFYVCSGVCCACTNIVVVDSIYSAYNIYTDRLNIFVYRNTSKLVTYCIHVLLCRKSAARQFSYGQEIASGCVVIQ